MCHPLIDHYLSWVNQRSKNTTANDLGEYPHLHDVFNLTLAPTTRAPYSLIGDIIGDAFSAVTNFKQHVAFCNSSLETCQFLVGLIVGPPLDTRGWNWTHPVVNLQFDS